MDGARPHRWLDAHSTGHCPPAGRPRSCPGWASVPTHSTGPLGRLGKGLLATSGDKAAGGQAGNERFPGLSVPPRQNEAVVPASRGPGVRDGGGTPFSLPAPGSASLLAHSLPWPSHLSSSCHGPHPAVRGPAACEGEGGCWEEPAVARAHLSRPPSHRLRQQLLQSRDTEVEVSEQKAAAGPGGASQPEVRPSQPKPGPGSPVSRGGRMEAGGRRQRAGGRCPRGL